MIKLILVSILGLIVRLTFINSHDFWFDEAYSSFVATQPFGKIITAAIIEKNPPVYYFLLKFWSQFGQSPVHLRLLSLIFGTLSIPLFYKLATKLASIKTAFWATLLLSLSPLHAYFSTETRMYSLLVFTSLSAALLFVNYLEKNKMKDLAVFLFCSTVGFYTHNYFLLLIIAFNLIYFLKTKKIKIEWLTSQLIILILISPWLLVTLSPNNFACWCFSPLLAIPAALASFAVGGTGITTLKEILEKAPLWIIVIYSLTSFCLFGLFLRGFSSKNATLNFLFFAPLILITVVSLFINVLSPRALIILSPFYYLQIASAFGKLQKIMVVFTFSLLILSLYATFQIKNLAQIPLKSLSNLFAPTEKTAIVHSSSTTFYPLIFYHKYQGNEFLLKSQNEKTPIYKLGNFLKDPKALLTYPNVLFLVDFKWTNQKIATEAIDEFKKDYKLDKEDTYNTLGVYYFSK